VFITENIFSKKRLQETSSFIFMSATLAAVVYLLPATSVKPSRESGGYTVFKNPDSSQLSIISFGIDAEKVYMPRTPLGRKLMALREKAIAGGMPLMSSAEISEEISHRRGELR